MESCIKEIGKCVKEIFGNHCQSPRFKKIIEHLKNEGGIPFIVYDVENELKEEGGGVTTIDIPFDFINFIAVK